MDINTLLNSLSPKEREEMIEFLRQPNVIFCEDADDLLAAIKGITEKKETH